MSVLQVVIIVRGIESIRIAEKASAPVLIALSAAVLIWAVRTAGGWGPMLSQVRPQQPRTGACCRLSPHCRGGTQSRRGCALPRLRSLGLACRCMASSGSPFGRP